jgi:stage V sporulation protein S
MEPLRVSSKSATSGVAGAIAGIIRDQHHVEIQAIGAGAVNQAVKAMALATTFLREDGITIAFTAIRTDVEISGAVKTAIRFIIEPR